MKVCLIGDGLVSLTLANVLIQKDLFVDIYSVKKNNFNDQSRTLGISKSNIDFFNNEIIILKKFYGIFKKSKFLQTKIIKKSYLNLIIKVIKFFR
jgi:2-octaprenyl-6-methoxyphenol hydroxylase